MKVIPAAGTVTVPVAVSPALAAIFVPSANVRSWAIAPVFLKLTLYVPAAGDGDRARLEPEVERLDRDLARAGRRSRARDRDGAGRRARGRERAARAAAAEGTAAAADADGAGAKVQPGALPVEQAAVAVATTKHEGDPGECEAGSCGPSEQLPNSK